MAGLRSRFPMIRTAGQLALHLARYVWAAPVSLAGLIPLGFVLARGGSVRISDGVIEAVLPATRREQRTPYDAITLGHVVVARGYRELDALRAHELQHVRQYETWGALLLLAYPLSSLIQVFRGRRPYWDNYFEVQARERSRTASRPPG